MSDKRPRGCAFDCCLEIFGESAASVESGESALNDPASRQNFESLCGIGALDDLHGPAPHCCQSLLQLVASIAAISEDVSEPGIQPPNRSQDINRAVTVLDAGAMNHQADQVARSVSDDVAFATFDLFSGVISSWPTTFGRFHRLAVNDAGGRAWLSSNLFTRGHHQHVVDDFPAPVARPLIEVALRRRVGRELLRQLSPLASCRSNVEHRVDDVAQISCARPSKPTCGRHKGRDPCLAGRLHSVDRPADTAGGWFQSKASVAPSCLANQRNHNLPKSPTSFSVRHLQPRRVRGAKLRASERFCWCAAAGSESIWGCHFRPTWTR